MGKLKRTRQAAEAFSHRRSIFRMLSDTLRGSYRMSMLTSMVLLLGIAYIVLPFDFDWIPFVGWIDDGFVFYWITRRLVAEAKRYNSSSKLANNDGN